MCNLIDVQAFTAGVIILLITLDYPSYYQDDDWDIDIVSYKSWIELHKNIPMELRRKLRSS
jgi:hypothetical protein